MKKLALIVFMMAVNQIKAQSKWSFGGSASVDYSYRFNEKGNERFFFQAIKP